MTSVSTKASGMGFGTSLGKPVFVRCRQHFFPAHRLLERARGAGKGPHVGEPRLAEENVPLIIDGKDKLCACLQPECFANLSRDGDLALACDSRYYLLHVVI